MHPSEPFPHFVDDYLSYLYEVYPGRASLDGVHLHDDLLENLSRSGIDAHIRALAGFSRRLYQIDATALQAVEQVEHQIVAARLEAEMFELEQVRTLERSPHVYADILAASLASQTMFAYAPEAERARRTLSKLRQLPALVQAARDNVREPAGILVKVGLDTWRGVLRLIERDLPRAFATLDDLHVLGDLADASTEAVTSVQGYVEHLEKDLAPRAKASFRLGAEAFQQKLKLEEGIGLSAERLLEVALRELTATQEEFRAVASRLDAADPLAAWRATKARHPEPGGLLDAARSQLAELSTFLSRQGLVSMPAGEPVEVAASPEFYRWTAASMWTPGPFETRPSRAYYFLTDVDRRWPPERQTEHLRDLNYPALWTLSMHEVYPGHFLHVQHLRRVESKVRKSAFFASSAFVEGWAHYCEQMMIEAGFRKGDAALRLGQLADALVRLARVVVAVRLHCEDLSVEQGMRFFRDEAYLEEATARREAERGTFDPTYLVYSIGRLMLLKLRHDCREEMDGRFTLRGFHDTLLGQGVAPVWAHRRLMLRQDTAAVLD
ncbi:MAG: DUF885 domain-containing protein [Acidimicrobiia bacterium]|nr:DUF885 domain-containing protein [Acidimicrobiia bacterium]